MTKQTQDNLQKRYQLHSSQFINIAFGKYQKRNDMVEFVKNDSFPEPDEDGKKRMEWGVKHEADGIANWLIHCSGGKYPQHILDEQKDFLLENVFNLDDGNIVDLSSKPDGISDDGTTIIEIKCPNEGVKLRKDLDNKKSELDNNLSDLTRERAEYREMLPKIKAMLQNGFVTYKNWCWLGGKS